MKIAFVTPEFITEPATYDGGLANYVARISLALTLAGHIAHVFVSSDKDEVIDYQGVIVHRVKIDYNDMMFKVRKMLTFHKQDLTQMWLHYSRTLNRRLAEIHSQEDFDVVQYASYGAMAFYRLQNVPSVVRLSSYEPLHRAARGGGEPTVDELNVERIEKEALLKADAVFGPSKLSADAVERDLGINVTLIESPFILETKETDDSIYKENFAGKKYLLYFGTLSYLKGIKIIMQILPDLLEKHKDLYFVFIGKAEPAMLAGIEELNHKRVIYLDRLPHSQLYPIIQGAVAAVMPSLYDNLPNTCIEAMAFGKIVIGTEGASYDQLIVDSLSGFLCQKNDPVTLLDAIEKVLSLTDAKREEVGDNAKQRIELLRPDRIADQVIGFYTKTIQQFNE
jgi:glycogen synthase